MQYSSEELRVAINKSDLPDNIKLEFKQSSGGIGERQVYHLMSVLGVGGYNPELPLYARLVLDSTKALEQARAGNATLLLKYLANSVIDPNTNFGRDLIPFILDIKEHEMSMLSESVTKVVLEGLNKFEQKIFKFLPTEEIARLVVANLLYFVHSELDIVKDFRWMYYVASPVYDNGVWGRQFLPLLKKNQELLGESIKVGEKELAPTVENWLLEYDAFTGKPGPQREAFDRLHFVQNNENAKRLSKDNAGVLLKLCELYDWFSDPYVTEVEVAEFEDIAPATARVGMVNEKALNETRRLEETGIETNKSVEVESANVQGRLSEQEDREEETGLSMVAGKERVKNQESRIKTKEILRSDDLPKMKENATNVVSSTSNKMDSGLPSTVAKAMADRSQGVVETGMTAPKKQVQKSKLTSSNFAIQPSHKAMADHGATSDRQASFLTSSRKALPAQPEEKLLRAPTLADIKAEAEEKKRKVQADIDRKLATLKNQESRSKNQV